MVEAADAVEGLLQSECASGQMRRTGGVVAFLRAGAVRRRAGLGRLATLLTGRGQARRSMGRFEENGWFLRTPIHMRLHGEVVAEPGCFLAGLIVQQ